MTPRARACIFGGGRGARSSRGGVHYAGGQNFCHDTITNAQRCGRVSSPKHWIRSPGLQVARVPLGDRLDKSARDN